MLFSSAQRRTGARVALSASALALAMASAMPAHAQDGAAPAQEDGAEAVQDDSVPAGDIVVTGSRIRGVAPVGSSVIAVGAAELQNTTASSVTDALKQVPQIFATGITDATFSATSGSGGSNLTRGAAINLRGINPSATLTLIDGQRITTSGVAAAFVDPSMIPTFAIERIEVVPDGSSAIYGSDAVAGVVNIILKKKMEGLQVQFRDTIGDGFSKYQAGMILGHGWSTGQVTLAAEYIHNNSLYTSERDYLYQDQRGLGGHDYRASTCNPGNILIGGVSYAVPAGNPTSGSGLVANTRNLCDVGLATIIPRTTRFNVIGYVEQSFGDSVKLSAQAYYNRREFLSEFGAQGSTLTSFVTLTVPSTNAFYIAPTGTTPASESVEYSYLPQRGNMSASGKLDTYGVFAKAEVKLGTWRAELSGTHSDNQEIIYSRAINTAAQTAALASSNPATALDPYGNRTSAAVIDQIFTGLFWPSAHSRLSTAALRLDGPVFELPGGATRVAVGAEYQDAYLYFGTMRGTTAAPAFTSRFATRKVKSLYGELYVPIFGAGNAMPGLRKLELSLAGRYDNYSDFGDTWNPKIGLTWVPTTGLNLHGSYGTSFRAPGLEQLMTNTTGIQIVNAVDPKSSTGRTNGLAIRSVTAGLGPEDATTWSFGATISPAAAPSLSISLNYFKMKYGGQIFAVEPADALINESLYADLITRNPTTTQINQVLNMGLPILGTVPANIGFIVDARPYNRGTTKTDGLDFQASYSIDTESAGKFGIDLNGLYFFKYEFQVSPLAPVVDRLNTITNPLRFRMRGGLDWQLGGVNANLWLNYANSYRNTQVTPVQTVKSWTTADLHLGYDFNGSGVTDGLALTLDVSNLFDAKPPYVDVVAGYDPQEANALGRVITLGIRKKF
jgi:iron complex outermembrane recepter protein